MYRFSRITFELNKIVDLFEYHRIFLSKTHRNIYFFFNSEGQVENMTSCQGNVAVGLSAGCLLLLLLFCWPRPQHCNNVVSDWFDRQQCWVFRPRPHYTFIWEACKLLTTYSLYCSVGKEGFYMGRDGVLLTDQNFGFGYVTESLSLIKKINGGRSE